jgi:hypothetical protein
MATGSTNECKWQALTTILSKGGHISDLTYEFVGNLITARYPGETLLDNMSDRWHQLFLLDTGIENRSDAAVVWLMAEGAVGEHINDLWNDYWCNVQGGGGSGGAFDDGYSDGFS